MRVLITGSTSWTNADTVRRELAALPAGSVIVTGDTPGIDALAISLAHELGLTVEAMKKNSADRGLHPKASWKGLNERMLATGVELVLAFHAEYGQPGFARGTVHMVELARAAGVETRIFTA